MVSPRPRLVPEDVEERPEKAGAYAAHALCGAAGDAPAHALAFLDELIALGDDPRTRLLPSRFDVADVVPGAAAGGVEERRATNPAR